MRYQGRGYDIEVSKELCEHGRARKEYDILDAQIKPVWIMTYQAFVEQVSNRQYLSESSNPPSRRVSSHPS